MLAKKKKEEENLYTDEQKEAEKKQWFCTPQHRTPKRDDTLSEAHQKPA